MKLPLPALPPCRPYQLRALERGRELVAQGASSLLLCMPTGTGKTRTAVEACLCHVRLGGVVLLVAPRRELVAQITEAVERARLELEHVVFVRTIQELSVPGAVIPPATMVVLDEARHYVADEWGKLRAALPDAVYLGLDATPERGDGRGLGGMFEHLIEAITVREAVEQGYLVPCEVIRPAKPLGGDFAQDPLAAWSHHAAGASTVIFCHSVVAAQKLAQRFCDRGIPAAALWGAMPVVERDNALRLFAEGEITVLTNMHILTEGWDAPRAEVVILAASCPTPGGYLQRVGRAMRPFPGKKRMLLLDLPGVSHDHGEPDDDRTWRLDGRACRRAADADVRFCPVCGAVVRTSECGCGHKGEMRRRKPRVLGLPMDRFARQRQQTDAEKAQALARMLADTRRKGHQRWAAFRRFQGVYGAMPTTLIKTLAQRVFLQR